MLPIPTLAPTRRRALRRAVSLECAVHSPLWDGPAWYQATDVSPFGLWLHSDLALELGDRVVLGFRPPRWPEWAWPVTAVGEVVRVSLPRRRGDRHPAGMAVRFTEIDPETAAQMQLRLRGLPPALPPRRTPGPVIDIDLPQALVLSDGTCFELRAEAELLTAGRPPRARAEKRTARRRVRPELSGRPRPVRRARRGLARAGRKPQLRLVG